MQFLDRRTHPSSAEPTQVTTVQSEFRIAGFRDNKKPLLELLKLKVSTQTINVV